jgi:hypothetical protein
LTLRLAALSRALHARPARTRADEHRDFGVLERGHRIAVRLHSREQRERAVVQFHHHTLEPLLRLLIGDLEQLQVDRLVLAEHLSRGNPEQDGITDLAGGTGDGDADGRFTHGVGLQRKDGKVLLRVRMGNGEGEEQRARFL